MTGSQASSLEYGTIDQLLAVNASLDAQLLAAAAVAGDGYGATASDDEWTTRQILGHLSEFPHFFAGELRRYVADRAVVIGRTHDHSARIAAVDRGYVGARPREEFIYAMRDAFAELRETLQRLKDEDLDMPTNNVRYGREPLRAFLDRYVIRHKADHLRQLRRTGESI